MSDEGGWSLFISTRLGGALKISNFITCLLYTTVLEVNYLFHVESARNLKNSSPPPPLEIEWWPPYLSAERSQSKDETLTQCCFNVLPPSATLAQH